MSEIKQPTVITVVLVPDAVRALKELTARDGDLSETDVINQALQIYNDLHNEVHVKKQRILLAPRFFGIKRRFSVTSLRGVQLL